MLASSLVQQLVAEQAGSPGTAGHQNSLAGGLACWQKGSEVRGGYLSTSMLSKRKRSMNSCSQQTNDLLAKHRWVTDTGLIKENLRFSVKYRTNVTNMTRLSIISLYVDNLFIYFAFVTIQFMKKFILHPWFISL